MKLELVHQHTLQSSGLALSRKLNIEQNDIVLSTFLSKFVGENNLTGCPSAWFSDIQTYYASDKAVHHALKALSLLYACRENNTEKNRNKRLALHSNQSAVLSVRQVVDVKDAKIPQSLVSSTFLLGLFEVSFIITSAQMETDSS